ncbi:MAG: hypothetical protein IJ985_02830 [Akkermansia sp.]|nr:hypothetical protein [Akkermansia sp.]
MKHGGTGKPPKLPKKRTHITEPSPSRIHGSGGRLIIARAAMAAPAPTSPSRIHGSGGRLILKKAKWDTKVPGWGVKTNCNVATPMP